tara:strand:+ start:50 stop:226 length:177 start_codon:yes stop_codon:yes gene_type:complete
MGVKQKIKIKKPINNIDEESLPEALLDVTEALRFEEHTEEEYRAHLKKFFKGEEDSDK